MPKIKEQWLLYTFAKGEFTPLSRAFETRQQAEKARADYPEKERRRIGVGVAKRSS